VDHLLSTTDELETLTSVVSFEAGKQITHFVERPPHRFVVVDRNRLHRATGDGPFEEITETPFPSRCFDPNLDDARLFGCGQLRDRGHFLVTEDGETWTPVLRYEDVRMRECPEGTAGAERNPIYWPAIQAWGVGPPIPSGNGGAENGEAGNGEVEPGDPPPGGGCACASPGGRAAGSAAFALLLLLGVPRRRRRAPLRPDEGRHGGPPG
jgi:MYXO-CTERM domain-containing protein